MNYNSINKEDLPALKFVSNRRGIKFCPCGKSNNDGKFAAFLGYDNKGYCHSCDTTFLPDLPKSDNGNNLQRKQYYTKPIALPKSIDYIPFELYQKQFDNGKHLFANNNFINWLKNSKRGKCAYNDATVTKLIESFLLGNSTNYKGWVLFPYIDIQGRVCNIKAMDYNPNTGSRVSVKNGDKEDRCYFIGKKVLNNPNANTTICFYGEHQLKGDNKPVKIFESEATATHAAAFYPNHVCLATGGKNGCKWTEIDKCSVLIGRKVTLYPDIDAHDEWVLKAEILRGYGIDVDVSQLIVGNAKKYAAMYDIDYSELKAKKFDLRDILKYKCINEILNSIQELGNVPTVEELLFAAFEDKVKVFDTKAPPPYVIFNYEGQVFKIANK